MKYLIITIIICSSYIVRAVTLEEYNMDGIEALINEIHKKDAVKQAVKNDEIGKVIKKLDKPVIKAPVAKVDKPVIKAPVAKVDKPAVEAKVVKPIVATKAVEAIADELPIIYDVADEFYNKLTKGVK